MTISRLLAKIMPIDLFCDAATDCGADYVLRDSAMISSIEKILKFMGFAWSILAFVLLVAFIAGGEYKDWQAIKRKVLTEDGGQAKGSLAELDGKITALEHRIDGIKLVATETSGNNDYACGETNKSEPNSLVFMSGLTDGTSCKVRNNNFYKRLDIVIPK